MPFCALQEGVTVPVHFPSLAWSASKEMLLLEFTYGQTSSTWRYFWVAWLKKLTRTPFSLQASETEGWTQLSRPDAWSLRPGFFASYEATAIGSEFDEPQSSSSWASETPVTACGTHSLDARSSPAQQTRWLTARSVP
ncbi:hypothetical protein [Streptomyces sp. NPDC007346]|uniref:hypothetical protein n=1 Tax=Streptomyces sp. NPDC007346 TaxID=3154682 RepID=UPI003456306F